MKYFKPIACLILCASLTLPYYDAREYTSFKPGGQYIILTFEDGPHPEYTPKLLDILKEKKIKATFFVTGANARNHPTILARMEKEGHDIANHGWDHSDLTKLSSTELKGQLIKTNRAITDSTTIIPQVIRAPYGTINKEVSDFIANHLRLHVVNWSIDVNNYLKMKPVLIGNKIAKDATPGDVLLMNDNTSWTLAVITHILDQLTDKNFEFLTIADVLLFPDDTPRGVGKEKPTFTYSKRKLRHK